MSIPPGDERVLLAFENKLVESPSAELTDAYIRLRIALGRDGDYDAVIKRLDTLEKRVNMVEGVAGVKRVPSFGSGEGLRLG